MKLTIIVPVLNEAQALTNFLRHLQPLRDAGNQVIVVDGGSCDQSASIAEPFCDLVLNSKPGRALQMNSGAAQAEGDWLIFLHADTWLPQPFREWSAAIAQSARSWGRFNVRLSGKRGIFRVIETCMNRRSALTGIATGDQALFIRRELFETLGGFADEPLMEDIEICRRLRRVGAPLCLSQQVKTSSRRWESRGALRTILLMWELRLRYFFGAKPADLVQRYYPSN